MGIYKALLLAGCAAPSRWPAGRGADVDCNVTPVRRLVPGEREGKIVVTRSRIQRQDFNSTTRGDRRRGAARAVSTAALESNSTSCPQFVAGADPDRRRDIQPTATNTPARDRVAARHRRHRNLVLSTAVVRPPSNAWDVTDIPRSRPPRSRRRGHLGRCFGDVLALDAVAGVT
jgi:hypothetical protein